MSTQRKKPHWKKSRKTSRSKQFFRPTLEGLEDRFAPAVSVTGGFSGMSNTGSNPPDPNMAAGPNYIVETVNSSIAIYNKATGALVSREALATLFTGLVQGSDQFDPSVLYDDQAGRFVVEAQVCDAFNSKAYVDI